ncbi:MAG: hypothetical protein Fur0022_18290 [Anaerolineales bacterium]
MKNTIFQRKILWAFAGVALLLMLFFTFANFAYARTLVDESITSNLRELINKDEILYYSATVYQRTNPNINEPPDPYHLPVKPFYTGEQVIERWITQDTLKEKTTITINDQKILLREFILTPDIVSFYDAVNGYVDTSSRESTNDKNQSSVNSFSWIEGVRKSSWGDDAWVIKFIAEDALPSDFTTQSNKLIFQGPFAADLEFSQIQREWEVDVKTGLVVSQALVALTSSGPVVLSSETRTQPTVISMSEMPEGWERFSVSSEVISALSETESDTDISLGNEWTPQSVSEKVDFDFYLPSEDSLEKYAFDRTDVFYRPDKDFELPALAFEIYASAINGIGVEIIYLSRHPDNPDKPQALAIYQAPTAELVPLLQQSLPIWHSSKAISIKMGDQERNAWIVSGGLLRSEGDNPIVGILIELNGTFLYLEGQNIPENELITVAQSLQPYSSK